MSCDPRLPLLGCALFAAVVVSLQGLTALLLALGLAVILAGRAVLDGVIAPRRVLGRLAVLEGTVALAVLTLPFTLPAPDWTLPVIGGISREGTRAALTILLKSAAVGLVMLVWLGPLGPGGVARGLGRLGLPPRLVLLLVLTARYITVLEAEYRRLRTAMRVRGFHPGFNRHTWRSLGYLIGMLIIRGLERAERVQAAMLCRGFDGRIRSLTPDLPARRRDLGLVAGMMGAGLALLLFDRA